MIAPLFIAIYASGSVFDADVRPDRVLDLSISGGQSFWVGGVAGAAWYRLSRTAMWTIDLDPAGKRLLEVRWLGLVTAPVTADVTVESGNGVTVTGVDATIERCRFMVEGSGAVLRLDIAHGSAGQVEVVRLLARSTGGVA